MKKLFLITILLAGCFTFANAQEAVAEINEIAQIEQIVNDDYKTVTLGELETVVQETIKNLVGEDNEIKTIEFDAETQYTKITFSKKEDDSEKVVILNKEGKEVTE